MYKLLSVAELKLQIRSIQGIAILFLLSLSISTSPSVLLAQTFENPEGIKEVELFELPDEINLNETTFFFNTVKQDNVICMDAGFANELTYSGHLEDSFCYITNPDGTETIISRDELAQSEAPFAEHSLVFIDLADFINIDLENNTEIEDVAVKEIYNAVMSFEYNEEPLYLTKDNDITVLANDEQVIPYTSLKSRDQTILLTANNGQQAKTNSYGAGKKVARTVIRKIFKPGNAVDRAKRFITTKRTVTSQKVIRCRVTKRKLIERSVVEEPRFFFRYQWVQELIFSQPDPNGPVITSVKKMLKKK